MCGCKIFQFEAALGPQRYTIEKSGKLKITDHAINMYAERIELGVLKNPVGSIVGRLRHKDIQKQALPEHVTRHKVKRYGDTDNLEICEHRESTMHFLPER